MRILIYSYNYHPEPIGIAPLMTELAEGLVRRGHEVRVVTGMPWYPKQEIHPNYQGKLYCTENWNGVKIQRCYVRARAKRGLVNRVLFELSFVSFSFLQALWGWRPDILLFTVPGLPVGVPATVLGWLYRCPVILNLQDILPEAAVRVGLVSNPKLIRVFEALEQFNYRTATAIAAIAEGFRENLLSKDVPDRKIALIPNWVNTDFIQPLPKENSYFRQDNGLGGKFVALYSGNIALTQGLETAIDAAVRLQDLPEIAIVIVGDEKALKRLETYRQERGADNVLLVPFQPREKLPEMLAAADVGLIIQKKNIVSFNMPSKFQVLLGSGRAIVASVPLGGTADRAISAAGGIVVPPEDPAALAEAIRNLYNNPERVKALGEQSRQVAIDHYALDQVLDRYEKLFAKLMSN